MHIFATRFLNIGKMNKTLIIIIISLLAFSCANHKAGENKLTVFHAGSLSIPIKELVEEFKKENPGTEIFAESSGSLDAARKITDLDKQCDVLAVADFHVIDKLMIPDHADWNFIFASNEMIIAYNKNSKYSSEINTENWNEILLRDDVIIGRSDPNADPCGYRTVFVFKLCEKSLGFNGLADKLLSKENTVIRPKEVDLLSLLETGNIDYLFIYKSVAEQHKLNYINLDDKINLSNPDYEDFYSTVSMKVAGKEPGKETEISGSSILYSFTIPKNSPNKDLALTFVMFLINPEKGSIILEKNGMKVVNWCDARYYDQLPVELQNSFVKSAIN